MKRREKEQTPEEQLDRALLNGFMYLPVLKFVMVLFIGIELFGCLMPLELNISLLGFFCHMLVAWILCPLLFGAQGNKTIRRIDMLGYFPVRKKEFIMSKSKIVFEYVRVFWPAVGVAEVLAVAFFDAKSFLVSMLAIPLFCLFATVLLLFVGTVDVHHHKKSRQPQS